MVKLKNEKIWVFSKKYALKPLPTTPVWFFFWNSPFMMAAVCIIIDHYNIYNDNLIIKLMMIDRCFVVTILP